MKLIPLILVSIMVPYLPPPSMITNSSISTEKKPASLPTKARCSCWSMWHPGAGSPAVKGLEELHKSYKDKGLVVCGFPCNQFGGQEPGSEAEIKSFVRSSLGLPFRCIPKSRSMGRTATPSMNLSSERTVRSRKCKVELHQDFDWQGWQTHRPLRQHDFPHLKKLIKAIEEALAG